MTDGHIHFTRSDIQDLDRIKRLNLINSITGIKPANLIGTISKDGRSNLAIFSSVIHLGSNPPLIGMVLRPTGEVPRHTYENIQQLGTYTINHIHQTFIERAHYTSAKFEEISEFDACGLTEEYLEGFEAPFVKESELKLGLKHVQSIPIELNGTILVIGEIQHLIVPERAIDQSGQLDLSSVADVGISGLNRYYALKKLAEYPYVRVSELPDWEKRK
ncbi:MAG: flavin reductase [Bacteroidota bacterium]